MRFYSNLTVDMTLVNTIAAGDTSIEVTPTTGLPVTYPYSLILDYLASAVEVVTVTGTVGVNLTVVRGEDGTSAQAHTGGAVVVHGGTARDLQEPQDHIAAATDVHGIGATAAVVGTTTTQILTNKTIDGDDNNLQNIPAAEVVGTFSTITATGTIQGADLVATDDITAGDAISSVSVTASGAVSGNTVAATTAVTGATGTFTGALQGVPVRSTGGLFYNTTVNVETEINAIDTRLDVLEDDTGEVTNFTVSFGAGWVAAALPRIGRRVGKLVTVRLTAERSGANITATANGIITTGTILTVTATDFVNTATTIIGAMTVNNSGGNARLAGGVLTGYSAYPGTTIATGDTIQTYFTFIEP